MRFDGRITFALAVAMVLAPMTGCIGTGEETVEQQFTPASADEETELGDEATSTGSRDRTPWSP
jgi:hypothetical protein